MPLALLHYFLIDQRANPSNATRAAIPNIRITNAAIRANGSNTKNLTILENILKSLSGFRVTYSSK